MILTFKEMANAGGQIKLDMMAEGIYTAMTTTVAGLLVGIIAYFRLQLPRDSCRSRGLQTRG